MAKPRRHIDSDAMHEKKRQRRILIFSLFIIGTLVFSTFAIYLNTNQGGGGQQLEYGEYEFDRKFYGENYVWTLELNGQDVEFQRLPEEVGYVSVDSGVVPLLKNAQQIVLATDMNSSDVMTVDYARLQLGLALQNTVNAMTVPNEDFNLPVINCSYATPQMPIVVFNTSPDSSVTKDGSCITVNAEQVDVLTIKDRLIYEYYGILKDGQVVE